MARSCMFCQGRKPDESMPIVHKRGCTEREKWYRRGVSDAVAALFEAVKDSPGLTPKAAEHLARGLEAQVRIRLPIEDEHPHGADGA